MPLVTRRLVLAAGSVSVTQAALAQPAVAGLGAIARANGIAFGAAVQGGLLVRDPAYAAAFQKDCALLVPEYEAKWEALQPAAGRFDLKPLDAVLRWARANGKAVRGHTLIWHKALPAWVEAAIAEGPEQARAVMATQIAAVLDRTQGQVRDWDVVNEVIADPAGSDTPQSEPGDLRASPWLAALGPSYIETALRLARARDATLRLTLNEYGIEEATPAADEKRRRLLALVRGLLERGVPLDAVGMQAHLQLSKPFDPAVLTAFINALRDLGLAVLITELDVRESWDAPQDLAARDALVAARTHAFVSTALAAGVRTVLTWGLSAGHSWLTTEPAVAMPEGRIHRSLPYDARWQRLGMWDALARAFAGR
jgi:endo-1,4-beta-xylanase